MKKIAFALEEFVMGGVEIELIQILNAIDYSRYEVTLYVEKWGGVLFQKINPNVRVKVWTYENRLTPAQIFNRIMCRIYSNDYDKNSYYSAKCMKDEMEVYDCAVAFKALSPFNTIFVAEHIKARKRILWVHGRTVLKPENFKIYEKIYQKFDHIFCVSQGTQKEFNINFQTCASKTSVFYNIIDIDDIVKKAEEYTAMDQTELNICSVGRLSPVKGFDRVVPIMQYLLKKFKIKWYIVGNGECYLELKKQIAEANLSEYIILVGEKTNPYPYIKECTVYVTPSYSEGYSLATREAKILLKPIVITNISGLNEQFENNKNGLVVESSVEGLAKGIEKLLLDEEMRKNFSESLKNECHQNHLQELEKLYEIIES